MKSESLKSFLAVTLIISANLLAGIYDGELLKVVIGADITLAGLLLELKWPGGN